MEMSSDFANGSFMPKSSTALENMKELILLDLKILLGADIDWQHSARQPELATAALSQADGDDDRSGSSKDRNEGTLLMLQMMRQCHWLRPQRLRIHRFWIRRTS